MRGFMALAAALSAFWLSVPAARADMPPVPQYAEPGHLADGNSFVAGTPILTDSGFKNIEDIRDGDLVLSFDIDSQQVVSQRVRDVTSRTESAIYEMGVEGTTIQVTRDHPFLTTAGWRRVVETSIGNVLIGYDGARHTITTCRVVTGGFTVYNFEVDFTGTFYVTDLRLLAH